MNIATSFALAVSVALLCGCAGEEQAKVAADNTAAMLKFYESEAKETLQNQQDVEKIRKDNLAKYSKRTDQAKAELQMVLDTWQITGNKAALAAYGALTDTSPAKVVAEDVLLNEATTVEKSAQVKLTQDYSSATKAISELGYRGSFEQRMTFLQKAIKATLDEIEAEKKKAETPTP